MKIIAKTLTFLLLISSAVALKAEGDTTKITFGKSRVIIIKDDSTDTDTTIIKKEIRYRYNKFAGLDLGVNGLLNASGGTKLSDDANFFDLNYSKSISVGLNFFEKYIPIANNNFGFTTGLGFEFNSYDLDRDVTFFTDSDTTFGFEDTTISIEKNRFKSTYLNLPLMFEVNTGKKADKSFHIAAGLLLSYRISSKTKQIFNRGGKSFKEKVRDDYNLNSFRYGLTARVGYGDMTFFAHYSLSQLFEDGKGPELYPFTIGISLLSF